MWRGEKTGVTNTEGHVFLPTSSRQYFTLYYPITYPSLSGQRGTALDIFSAQVPIGEAGDFLFSSL